MLVRKQRLLFSMQSSFQGLYQPCHWMTRTVDCGRGCQWVVSTAQSRRSCFFLCFVSTRGPPRPQVDFTAISRRDSRYQNLDFPRPFFPRFPQVSARRRHPVLRCLELVLCLCSFVLDFLFVWKAGFVSQWPGIEEAVLRAVEVVHAFVRRFPRCPT